MDALRSYTSAFGIGVGLLSALLTFFYRTRYKTLISIYQDGNDELRHQLSTAKDEKADCAKESAQWKAKYEEQEKLVKELQSRPDFAGLKKTISNNHKEVMLALSEITKTAVE